MPLQIKLNDTTTLVIAYLSLIPPGRFPDGGMSSGEVYTHLAPHGITLNLHLRMLTALQDRMACKGSPLIEVHNYYIILTPAGEVLRADILNAITTPTKETK